MKHSVGEQQYKKKKPEKEPKVKKSSEARFNHISD